MNTRLALLTAGLIFSAQSYAGASVDVEFNAEQEFSDVEAVQEKQSNYTRRIQRSFQKHLEDLARRLPEGQTLSVRFSDLDLAGKVFPSGTQAERRIIPNHYPAMQFEYSLTGEQGQVVKSGQATLEDKRYYTKINKVRRAESQSFLHEKRMLTEWFEATL